MIPFATRRLPGPITAVAPDGSDVRVLQGLKGGGMAHLELAQGHTGALGANRLRREPDRP